MGPIGWEGKELPRQGGTLGNLGQTMKFTFRSWQTHLPPATRQHRGQAENTLTRTKVPESLS